ncbi:UvrD-like helicase family protein [Streptomyces sp. 2333.5]|uniref:helix-hairpin-helix domain-containing protein n=1 Tax=unclassified Streptomyces TaxID=2593676 RepID=UPI000898E93B|nr:MULTISPECIES: helix-hairpin-helix domain-containing protein [unclassified Streptomyces]PJJ00995.1 UvrD-like helicase family protein [Streptomyces sp. 2333.5]SED14167.1 UvrD-like helicase C-terminal domain-containing protein [Streptomyces sp. 2112.2]
MSTDRLAGDTPPEQEAAPGTADAQTPAAAAAPGGNTAAAAAAAAPSGEAAAPGETVASDDGTTAPGDGSAEAARTDGPAEAAPGDATAADDGRTPPQDAAGPGEDAVASGPEAAAPGSEAAAPSSEARTAPAGAARDTAASGSAQATAAALAAAVRAVESGERSAASFFNAPRPARPAAPAGRPAQGAPSPGRPQDRPAGPAPEPARQQPAPEAGGPARPPVVDGGATGPAAGAAAPTGPAAAPAPAAYAPGAEGIRQVLAAGGAPEALADRAAEVLGERAAEALREDPWQLLAVPGVRPEQADGFARALLGPACGPGDERRAQALVGWLLEQAAVAGHSALEASALRAALAQRAVPDPDDALQTAIADGAVLVFQDAIEEPGRPRPVTDEDGEEAQPVRILLGLDRFAMAEESVADGLARLLNTFEAAAGPEDHPADGPAPDEDATAEDATAETEPAPAPAADEERPAAETEPDNGTEAGAEAIRPSGHADGTTNDTAARPVRPSAAEWEAAAAAAPSPSAAELIRAAAHSGLVAHTGAEAARAEPAALLAAARSLGLRAFGAAHTENGRRRLATDLTECAPGDPAIGTAAVTVSALLSGQQGPGRDADGALALDLLVVLDAPQLDLETAALLVESLPDGTRLVLSGDPGVLWSAGPGRLFADLLAARFCPQVASRTPDFGPIGELVSGIGIGELSQVEAPGKEVVIVPVRDAKEAVHRTVQLVADSVPRALGVPADRTQVITVGHGGAAGTRALNAALKERLNPGPGRFGGFDPGDRVAYAPAPGRTVPGTVTGADAAGLRLDCDGAAVVVPREQVGAGAVRHGWALTAHQAAGMRWPAAVVVLPGDAAGGLTRAWVYTAFSRGERHLSVVQGVDQALPRAVAEVPVKERTTRLRTLLQQSVQTTQEPSTAD